MTNTTLHAHVSTSSRDCDSTYSREYVMFMNDDEKNESIKADGINDFSDIHFKERILVHAISIYSEHGTLEFNAHGLDWSEPTEEGYSAAHVIWCEDDCEDESSYRDSTAESMGY